MAAIDLFESFTAGLSSTDKEELGQSIRACREDLRAARSEDARVRMVEQFIKGVRHLEKASARSDGS